MTKSMKSFTLALLSFSTYVFAQECAYTYEVNYEQGYLRGAYLAAGITCISNTDACTITREYTHEVSVTQEIAGGISSGLDLDEIFSVGADAGFSESWTTSDGTATSATVSCPAGGYRCGLHVQEHYIQTGGSRTHGIEVTDCSTPTETESYTVFAPKTLSGAPDNQNCIVDFFACLDSCETDNAPGKCDAPVVKNMPRCNPNPPAFPT